MREDQHPQQERGQAKIALVMVLLACGVAWLLVIFVALHLSNAL